MSGMTPSDTVEALIKTAADPCHPGGLVRPGAHKPLAQGGQSLPKESTVTAAETLAASSNWLCNFLLVFLGLVPTLLRCASPEEPAGIGSIFSATLSS